MKRKVLFSFLLMLLTVSFIYTQDEGSDSDTYDAPYLNWGIDTRALGMGGAHTGVPGTSAGVYYNPAMIDFLQTGHITGMHTFEREDRTYLSYVGYAQPFMFGSLGLGIVKAGRNEEVIMTDVLDDDFSADVFLLSYAYALDSISVGATFKNISEQYNDIGDRENSFGLDIGIGWNPIEKVYIGAAVKNIAAKMGDKNIPYTVRAGASMEVIPGLTVAGDMEKIQDIDDPIGHVGIEYTTKDIMQDDSAIALRLGANNNEVSTGLGFIFDNFIFDYAYVSQQNGAEDHSHHISFSFLFGSRPDRPDPKPKYPCVPCPGTGSAIEQPAARVVKQAPRLDIPEDEDIDRDGIPNSRDMCPQQPEDYDGFQDDDGCPDYDNDQDGVPDLADQCAMLPEDIDGFEDGDGCPDYDNDQDGVPDVNDDCPNSAEVFNGFKDADGCPDIAPVPPKWELEIYFDHDKAVVKQEYQKDLDYLVRIMKEEPTARIQIVGFASAPGNAEYNYELTVRRAEAVKQYLVSKGLEADRIETEGRSETYLQDSEDKSRRVTVIKIK